tara:strand:- start:408 stop:1325 length:918 start_codon:yes stop_codon:yes gene_type:complete
MNLKNFKLINNCPICNNKKISSKGKIKSGLKEINNFFFLKKCNKCNHRFLSKFPKKNYLVELHKINSKFLFGQDIHENYYKREFKNKGFKGVRPIKKHWIFEYINIDISKEYLEIGPGLCRVYKTFYSKKWNCHGIDLQPFIKAPGIVHKLSMIRNGKKDVAVAFDVIEHTNDPINFLKNINKKMKFNGKLFMTFPNADSFKSKIFGSKWNMVVPLAHINFFSKQSTKVALGKTGFKIIYIKSFSLVSPKRLIKNLIKLPIKLIFDLIRLDFKSIYLRIEEFLINIIDLLNGDQMKVVAIKNKKI